MYVKTENNNLLLWIVVEIFKVVYDVVTQTTNNVGFDIFCILHIFQIDLKDNYFYYLLTDKNLKNHI